MNQNKYISLAVLSLFLGSCGNSTPAPSSAANDIAAQAGTAADEAAAALKAAEETAAAAQETTAAKSAASSDIPTGGRPTNPEAENSVKAFINLHGELCAEIVRVRPLALPNTAEVTCIEYRGGSARVTYVINTVSGELQKAG